MESHFQKRMIEKSVRNYGIDLLRIFSMINIINLHIIRYSGFFRIKLDENKLKSVNRLDIFSFFPVNCFGLISGVIGYKKYKFANIIYIWFISLYYSIFDTFSLFILFEGKISIRDFILSFLPLLKKYHWYVNGYFIMYLFLPFMNFGINYLNKVTYIKLITNYILFFSFYHIIHVLMKTLDYNFLESGFSAFWLMILYLIGGFLGKYILNNSSYFSFWKNFFCLFIYFLSSFLSEIGIGERLFINYLSPTILCQAISLLILFSRLRIKNAFIIKIINFITPLNFSATLIHLILLGKNRIEKVIFGFYEKVREFDCHFFFFKIYGLSISIYIFCIIIDYFRLLIFNVLSIKKLCQYLERAIFI
jgi:surface polysaccharide O-acyltransferase-like enzyme